MIIGGIRSVYKLKFVHDNKMKYFIARRKASSSPIILPQYAEILFGKNICIKILQVIVTISYDVVYYECSLKNERNDDVVKELINLGFKEVDETWT
jgi:hypothetical protein